MIEIRRTLTINSFLGRIETRRENRENNVNQQNTIKDTQHS